MNWLANFIPAPIHLNSKERLRSCVGALIGIALTAGLTRLVVGSSSSLPLLLAPMGASAVLLFAVPASPLAQPWSLMGGNLISALVGVMCVQWIDSPMIAATVAVPLAIAAMFTLRCIHPPSGAVALTAVLGGASVHGLGYWFLLAPVGLNSLALLLSALLYHRLTRHRYPHRPPAASSQDSSGSPGSPAVFVKNDIDEAMLRRGELLDIDVADLQGLFHEVEMRAWHRHLKQLCCADVMTCNPRSVTPVTTADDAWRLLQRYGIKALPVVDEALKVVGVVTLIDFVLHINAETFSDWSSMMATTARRGQPLVLVSDVMRKQVNTVQLTQPVSALLPLFAKDGHHHLPVVDADHCLKGIITPADLIAGLHQVSLEQIAEAA